MRNNTRDHNIRIILGREKLVGKSRQERILQLVSHPSLINKAFQDWVIARVNTSTRKRIGVNHANA